MYVLLSAQWYPEHFTVVGVIVAPDFVSTKNSRENDKDLTRIRVFRLRDLIPNIWHLSSRANYNGLVTAQLCLGS